MEDEEEDIQNSSLDMQDDNNEEVGNENLLLELEDNGDSEGEDNTQNSSTEILETQT
jgi:hypothetical protein